MKINLVILMGVAIDMICSVLLLAHVTARVAQIGGQFIPFKYWYLAFYNFGWAIGLLYLHWMGLTKKYKDWIMINMLYQFILNSDGISGLATANLNALLDAALYILTINQVVMMIHMYLPEDALVKSKLLSKLEAYEFNIASTADFDAEKDGNEMKSLENVQFTATTVDRPSVAETRQESVKAPAKLESVSSLEKQMMGAFDTSEIKEEDREQVLMEITATGEEGIRKTCLRDTFPNVDIDVILQYLEFEERLVFSEAVESSDSKDVKYVLL